MNKVQKLRLLVEQRLTAAAEEIFVLFERTIAEYEEEVCRKKEENDKRQQLLDDVWIQKVPFHTAGCPADIQQLSVVKAEGPPDQNWSFSLDQKDLQPLHIKEEREELWTYQETDLIKFPSIGVPVKSENYNEEAHSSQLPQRQTEENKEEPDTDDCGGSEESRIFHPQRHLQTYTDEQTEDTEDSDDWMDNSETEALFHEKKPPGSSSAQQTDCGRPESDRKRVHIKDLKVFSKSKSRRKSVNKTSVETAMDTTRDKMSGPSVRARRKREKGEGISDVKNNVTVNVKGGERKRLYCSECEKPFKWESDLKAHMRVHTGERPFTCSTCNKGFSGKFNLQRHMATHTDEKPFSCSVCQKCFRRKNHLKYHMTTHIGEVVKNLPSGEIYFVTSHKETQKNLCSCLICKE